MIPLGRICKEISLVRHISTTANRNSKNINKQVKILGKLIGQKVSGSKGRWYPTKENVPSSYNFVKVNNTGKDSSRRVSVLNKLFMRHVTDLLATGEASQEIVGKGLEISRVKVCSDFSGVNVYWVAKGDLRDYDMEAVLNKFSAVLRHELSQLRVMGEVPKIRFVKDKIYANLVEVERILEKCDFGDDHKKIEDNLVMRDFGGYTDTEGVPRNQEDDEDDPIPPMRHDVFGLDHRKIMDRILIKMKKSKKAWQAYENNAQTATESEAAKETLLEDVQNKLKESQLKKEEFEKFIKRKKFAKNTPDRKKNLKIYEYCSEGAPEDEIDYAKKWDEGDYIEEYEKDKV